MDYIKTNCPNCGSILKDGICEFCGTKVDIANKIEAFNGKMCEVNLVIKMGNETKILPLKGYVNEVEIKYEPIVSCRSLDGTLNRVFNSHRTVEFNFSGEIRDEIM